MKDNFRILTSRVWVLKDFTMDRHTLGNIVKIVQTEKENIFILTEITTKATL